MDNSFARGLLCRLNPPQWAPGHQISGLAFCNDDTRLVSASWGGILSLWNSITGERMLRVREERHIHAFASSASAWAIGLEGKTIRIRSSRNGDLITTIDAPGATVTALAFSPDGQFLASATDGEICVWDTSSWTLVRKFYGHQKQVGALAISQSGLIVSCAENVRVRKLCDGSQIFETATIEYPYLCVAVAPDAKTIAIGGASLELWDIARRSRIHYDLARTDAVAFSENGKYLASSGLSAMLRVWDTASWEVIRAYDKEAQCLALRRDGKSCAFGSANRLHVVDFETMEVRQRSYSITGAVFGNDERLVAVCSDGYVREWDTQGREMASMHIGEGFTIAASTDADIVAIGDVRGDATAIWDRHDGRCLARVDGGKALFAPRQELIVTVCENEVLVSNMRTGHLKLSSAVGEDHVSCSAFSPDGKMLALGSYDHQVYLLMAGDYCLWTVLSGHDLGITAVTFSPDGTALATASTDNTVRIWDLGAMKVAHLFELNTWATSLTFLGSGNTMIVGLLNGRLLLMDCAAGTVVRREDPHDWRISQLCLSPSGVFLSSASYDGSVGIWRVAEMLAN